MGIGDTAATLLSKFWSISADRGKSSVTITASGLLLFAGLKMMTLIILNILWSCTETFDCTTFWPTVSYLSCFRGHDRLSNYTMTFWSVVLFFFFGGTWTAYKEVMGTWSHRLMMLISVVLTLGLPFLVIIDEANSSHIAPLEKIHYILTVGYMTLAMLWIFISLEAIWKLEGKMNRAQKEWTSFLKKYILFGLIMLGFNVFEWLYAYTESANWWINENVEGLCEWTVICLAVFLPFFYSLTFNRYEIRFTVT
jgi:hypothetical protein